LEDLNSLPFASTIVKLLSDDCNSEIILEPSAPFAISERPITAVLRKPLNLVVPSLFTFTPFPV